MRFAIIGVTFFIELNLTRARYLTVGATELISLLCLTQGTSSLLQVSQIIQNCHVFMFIRQRGA
ncbi:hypothetical protein XavaCFBP5823_03380 [Xanthomonas axonopodis pv. vasculorum]|nr:hypothetical protein XavaCFBP5823_03380 [Xanthomonas axonopodis pv. vasculorum]